MTLVCTGSLTSLTSNDGHGVDLLAHQLLSLPQQLTSQDHHRGGAITNLIILDLGDVYIQGAGIQACEKTVVLHTVQGMDLNM